MVQELTRWTEIEGIMRRRGMTGERPAESRPRPGLPFLRLLIFVLLAGAAMPVRSFAQG